MSEINRGPGVADPWVHTSLNAPEHPRLRDIGTCPPNLQLSSESGLLFSGRNRPAPGQLVLLGHLTDDHQIDPAIGGTSLGSVVELYRMILRVPSGRDQRGIEPVALDQECHDRGGARSGEFPVGLEAGIVDGHVVGVAFHPDLETSSSEDGCNSSQGRISAVQQLSLTAVEKSDLTQADHQTLGSDAHLDFMLTDFIPESRFELAPEFVDINSVAGSPGILVGSAGYFDNPDGRLHEIGTGRAGASRDADAFSRGTGEHTQLLKCSFDRGCHLGSLFLVGLGGSVQNYKEGKQKGDEISVGNKPALVVGVRLVFFLPAHALAPAAFWVGAFCLCSGR